jgi:hypothetical protein
LLPKAINSGDNSQMVWLFSATESSIIFVMHAVPRAQVTDRLPVAPKTPPRGPAGLTRLAGGLALAAGSPVHGVADAGRFLKQSRDYKRVQGRKARTKFGEVSPGERGPG